MEAAELVRGQLTVYRECDWYDSLVAPHACLIPDALDDEEDDAEEEEDDEDEDEDEDELLSRMLHAGLSTPAPTPLLRGSSAGRSRGRSRTSRSRPIASEAPRVAVAERSQVRSLAGEGSDDEEEVSEEEDVDEEPGLAAPGEVVAAVPGVADVEVAEAPRPSEKEAKVSEKAMKNANTVLPDGTRKQRAKRNACNAFFEHAPAGITVSGRYTKVAEMVSRFGLRIFASR